MIVSDHGMSDSAGLRLQKLAEFTDPENFEKVVDFGPFTHIALTDAANVQQVSSSGSPLSRNRSVG